jgi:hypothetical protein
VTFQRTEPNFHHRTLRLISEGGCWELGLSPYTHGTRIRLGRTGRPPQVLDFCLGHAPNLWARVLRAVIDRLSAVAETASAEEVDAVFPWAGTRPDPTIHLPLLLDFPARAVDAGD